MQDIKTAASTAQDKPKSLHAFQAAALLVYTHGHPNSTASGERGQWPRKMGNATHLNEGNRRTQFRPLRVSQFSQQPTT
jgi:hypothetical protein